MNTPVFTARYAHKTARLVCDFVAGMTDRFAMQEYQLVFSMQRVD